MSLDAAFLRGVGDLSGPVGLGDLSGSYAGSAAETVPAAQMRPLLFSEVPPHLNSMLLPRVGADGVMTSFLSPFGDSELTMQEIAEKAHQLQQRIDENAEREKAELRHAAEQKQEEVERHAADLVRHAASSIEAYKESQLQMAERQKAQRQAGARQQAEHAKRLIDQQAQD
eukprot:TRINITY_DN4486_c0_g1_i3.p1 TRINITY_DN4486_c0_g1~~TRINITY_DN4486_c0_g1_i3.p1  ORF type:complete len:184 (-),score=46.09 TRINITY_DN4486_c0_g1_i3:677-1189(-)